MTAALAVLITAPAALAARDTPFPVNGSYKGRTEQGLLTTFRIADQRVQSFTTSVQRFCSDGTTSFIRVTTTDLGGLQASRLRPRRNGARKIDVTVATSTGPTARVRATLRKGALTGTVVFSDVAALPPGPSAGGVTVTEPGPGATCSTEQSTTSNRITFQAHWG